MTCNIKENSLSYLKNNGVIEDTRMITAENMDKFNEANQYLTERAVTIYGLETDGRLLYDAEPVERTMIRNNDVVNSRKYTLYFATPVDELFNELSDLYDKYHAIREDKIAIVRSQQPEIIKAYVGPLYKDSGFFHYVADKSISSKVNKEVIFSNQNFIDTVRDKILYNDLLNDFESLTGLTFDINNKSAEGINTQEKFYNYLRKNNLDGIEITNSDNQVQFVKFSPVVKVEYSDTELDNFEVNDTTGTLKQEDQRFVMSRLDSMNWYSSTELDKLYESYSPEQINQLLEEDEDNAKTIFNNLLYPDEFINDIFVDDRAVNDQIRKCK